MGLQWVLSDATHDVVYELKGAPYEKGVIHLLILYRHT